MIPAWVLWTLGFGIGTFLFFGALSLTYIGFLAATEYKPKVEINGYTISTANHGFKRGDVLNVSGQDFIIKEVLRNGTITLRDKPSLCERISYSFKTAFNKIFGGKNGKV